MVPLFTRHLALPKYTTGNRNFRVRYSCKQITNFCRKFVDFLIFFDNDAYAVT